MFSKTEKGETKKGSKEAGFLPTGEQYTGMYKAWHCFAVLTALQQLQQTGIVRLLFLSRGSPWL